MAVDNRPTPFAEVMTQIEGLPADKRVDAMLEIFVHVLNSRDTDSIRNLRDQIMERFSTCGSSFETCVTVIEFIDGYLAVRDLRDRGATVCG